MKNQTEINPDINMAGIDHDINTTVINPEAIQTTSINPALVYTEHNSIPFGTILGKKYEIVRRLSDASGEADLYLCTYEDQEYVAKVYRRKQAVKPEVISVLKLIKSPYVATLFASGEYNGFPFQILPYYKNGSLQNKTFTFTELKENIIPCINEALKVLHDNDILHKDLKPSNIMLLDDGKSVALIDFGISSFLEDGNTVLLTKTGMTPEYSAPETFKSLYLEESDYYSFGITLYELYFGFTPYRNLSTEEIARYTAIQRIPFPEDTPKELQSLISALTYFDITNRNNKDNPNRRWTYTEVVNWCKGKKQVSPGRGEGTTTEMMIPTYTFLGEKYNDISSIVTAFASNWEEGKKQLYRGLMSGFFKNFNPELAGYCIDAEEEVEEAIEKEDLIFWNLLYKICPNAKGFYWKGRIYESLPALGDEMFQLLWRGDKSDYDYWDSILDNKLLTYYLSRIKSKNESLILASSALEMSHAFVYENEREKLINYYSMAYLLSGQKKLRVSEKYFDSISELIAYMRTLIESSYEEFENFCNKLIDSEKGLNIQFESWLIAQGQRDVIAEWKLGLMS